MTTRSAVVTGASTGIGRATVGELVAAGFHVWATVRTEKDAASLGAEHGAAVTPLLVDLLDEDSVRAAGARIVAAGPVHALVNNAGIAVPAPLEIIPIDQFRRQLEVNLVGQLLMTQVVLPALFQAKDARIVFVGSISGRIAGPVLGAYSASKHGIVGMAGSLRAELAPYGVTVCLVEPGVIATPIWTTAATAGTELLDSLPPTERYTAQIAGARRRAASGASGLDPRVVARVIHRAIVSPRPKPRQVVGRDARIGAALVRLLPFRAIYRLTAGKP